MKTAAEKTCQPGLFKDCYWGRYPVDRGQSSIIRNRDRMIEEFGLVRALPRPTVQLELLWDLMDHLESYRTQRGTTLVLISPYSPSPADKAYLLQQGWREIYPVYHTRATSLIREFAHGRELVRWVRAENRKRQRQDEYLP